MFWKLQYLLIMLSLLSTQSKTTNNIWCLNSIELQAKDTLLQVETYHPSHCNIMCNASSSCDMFTYLYNYTCQLYSYSEVDTANMMFILNTNVWGTCLMSDISRISTMIGVQMAKSLNLTQSALCVVNYNTRGINIQKVPPEPPFSPKNISQCWQACLNRSDCTHVVFQPKYKEMPVSACWLKAYYNQGISGVNGIDSMTQASCFKSKEDFQSLGYDDASEFLFITNTLSSKNNNNTYVPYLLLIFVSILICVLIQSYNIP
jgi:hypothetical protein